MTTTKQADALDYMITLADGSVMEYSGHWNGALRQGLRFQGDMLEAAGYNRDADVPALRLMSVTVRDDRKPTCAHLPY